METGEDTPGDGGRGGDGVRGRRAGAEEREESPVRGEMWAGAASRGTEGPSWWDHRTDTAELSWAGWTLNMLPAQHQQIIIFIFLKMGKNNSSSAFMNQMILIMF